MSGGYRVHLQTTEGANGLLYLGPKITRHLVGKVYFGGFEWAFNLAPTPDGRLVFTTEHVAFVDEHFRGSSPLGEGHFESKLEDDLIGDRALLRAGALGSVSNWTAYHFHDTSLTAGMRRQHALNDNLSFRQDAENLASLLYLIQRRDPDCYRRIRDVVRLAAPFFDDFKLRPIPTNPDMIQLEWRQVGSDYPFLAHQLSDGTLRFICLATALLQPNRPATVLFDEPELGLHPYALTLLGSLFKQAGEQIIVSTQSALLLNEFAPEDIIVVERTNGESTFRRLNSADLSQWLEEYTLGELWQKNLLGGRPREDRVPEPVPGGNPH